MSDPNVSTAPSVGNIVPRVFRRDSEVLCNSDDVRKQFKKRHDNVLRDIRDMDLPSELRAAWFIPTFYIGEDGSTRPAFDMTKDGFTLLVMGWTGKKAMEFKIAYIAEFNRLMFEGPRADLSVREKLDIVEAVRRSKAGPLGSAQAILDLGLSNVPALHDAVRRSPGQAEWKFDVDDAPPASATEVN